MSDKLIVSKKWKRQKLLMFLQLSLSPLIGLLYVYFCGWGGKRRSAVCNVTGDLIGMILLLILFFICIKDREDRTFRTGCFTSLLSATSLALFLDLICWMVNEVPELCTVNIIANTGYYLIGIPETVFYWLYLIEVSDIEDTKSLKKYTVVIAVCEALAFIAIIGNLFGHYYFTVSADGVYTRGKWHMFCQTYMIVLVVCFIVLISRMNVSKSKKSALLSFISIPVVATLFQSAVYGISIIYISTVFSLFIIYGNVFAEQNRELAAKKLEVVEKEKEILLAAQEHERIETELNLASEIQTHVLPRSFPPYPERKEFSLFASMTPAKEVGGDFYDLFLVDKTHLALVIADVSGKGVPAALYMMVAKTMIKNAAMQGLSPKDIFEFVNNQLCDGVGEIEMFVTAWMGIIDTADGKMVACNAGHEYPAVCRADGSFELLKDKHGFVLGGMEGMKYKNYEYSFKDGDSLFVYTDGVPEAADDILDRFGTGRMLDALNKAPHAAPDDLIAAVHAAVDAFTGEAQQFDDMTMLAFRMEKKEG